MRCKGGLPEKVRVEERHFRAALKAEDDVGFALWNSLSNISQLFILRVRALRRRFLAHAPDCVARQH